MTTQETKTVDGKICLLHHRRDRKPDARSHGTLQQDFTLFVNGLKLNVHYTDKQSAKDLATRLETKLKNRLAQLETKSRCQIETLPTYLL